VTGARGSAVLAVLAGCVAGGVVALAGDARGGLVTAVSLVPAGVGVVGLAHIAVRRGRRLTSLRRHVALTGAIGVGGTVLVLALFAGFMFVSTHDAALAALAGAYAGLVALLAGRIMTGPVLRDVDALRAALHAVGQGEREPALSTEGSDELAGLGAEVKAMATKLGTEERARRELVAAVSHDLRTPITSLQLLAEAVDDDMVSPEERREYLSRLTVHVRALSALIDDLFELSRIESGDISWSLEQVRLDELVEETVSALQTQARARAVDVRWEVPHDLAPASANPEKLQRVLFNLILNAIHHTPPDGSVVVRAERAATGLEVEVADSGGGIADTERGRVFDAFFRGGDATARTDGNAGLGLAISRAIVEAHGGRIWLEEGAQGTRVRFSLQAA